MSSQPLVISYRRQVLSGPVLFLEQDPPDPSAGLVTASVVVSNLLGSLLGGEVLQPVCGGFDGETYRPTIYAYPSDPLLNYDFGLSWGSPGKRIIEEVTLSEVVSFTMSDRQNLKYPSRRVLEFDWLGDCYDVAGGIIARPVLMVDGQNLVNNRKCYGSALVHHRVVRHRYECKLTPRPNAVENALTSAAWAVWRDGYVWLAIDPPTGENSDGPCGGTTLTTGRPRRRYVPKYAWGNRETTVDYCTQVADKPVITGHEEWEWQRI